MADMLSQCPGVCVRHKVLPVVMGAKRRQYEAIAPVNSFLHVDDFSGPRQLADYLHLLAANDTLYNEYFRWRQTQWSEVDTRYWCRLCALLHWRDEVNYVSWYDDYDQWWNGACYRPNNLPWFQRNLSPTNMPIHIPYGPHVGWYLGPRWVLKHRHRPSFKFPPPWQH